jgi:Golgi phosphoprotein 3
MNTNYFIYQQLLLLMMKDKDGTIFSGIFYHQALAGAFIADLLLTSHIDIDETKKTKRIRLLNSTPTGDDLLDECLGKLQNAKRPTSLQNWVSKFASIKQLKHRAAEGLCRSGILSMKEDTVLLLFSRKIYPEINPVPEQNIMNRLQQAIFTDSNDIDAETIVLLALSKSADILGKIFDKKELKTRKKRIEQIVNGQLIGKATQEVIQSVQAAIMIATIMPAIMVSTTAATH